MLLRALRNLGCGGTKTPHGAAGCGGAREYQVVLRFVSCALTDFRYGGPANGSPHVPRTGPGGVGQFRDTCGNMMSITPICCFGCDYSAAEARTRDRRIRPASPIRSLTRAKLSGSPSGTAIPASFNAKIGSPREAFLPPTSACRSRVISLKERMCEAFSGIVIISSGFKKNCRFAGSLRLPLSEPTFFSYGAACRPRPRFAQTNVGVPTRFRWVAFCHDNFTIFLCLLRKADEIPLLSRLQNSDSSTARAGVTHDRLARDRFIPASGFFNSASWP